MSHSNIAFGIALILSFIYIGLAIAAFSHMKPEHRAKEMYRLLAFSFWWPFYDVYEQPARRLRIVGVLALAASVGAYLLWWNQP